MNKPACFISKAPGTQWLTALLLLSLLALTGFAASVQAKPSGSITPRIIGGVDASPTAYPWATALLTSNVSNVFNAQFCGGTLIASEWVLTAAHCVADIASASDIDVAVGFSDLNDVDLVRIAVSAIYVHPQFDTVVLDNDLALLKLATPSANTPVALADNTLTDSIYASNFLMTIIGWGNTSATRTPPIPDSYPILLQETQIPPFNFATCNSIYSNALTANMICAAGTAAGDKDTCQGDSGGPMLYLNPDDSLWYQTGVTSFGNGCAQPNIPGVYARVANYLNWINGVRFFDATFPDGYQFGFQGVGRTATQTLTITNNSGATITVTNVSLATMTDFTFTETCTGGSIANGGSCTITLQYIVTSAGAELDTLTIDLDTGDSFDNPVSGFGLATIDATALDENPGRSWYSGGIHPGWSPISIASSNGGTAMRSGNITHNQSSVMLSYVTGLTNLSFRWKASTELGFDFLNFYVDGILIDSISGDQDWQQKNVNITNSDHIVSWVYQKDDSISSLLDTVCLDSVNTPFAGSTGGGTCGTVVVNNGGGGGGGGAINSLLLLLLALITVTRFFYVRQKRHHITIKK